MYNFSYWDQYLICPTYTITTNMSITRCWEVIVYYNDNSLKKASFIVSADNESQANVIVSSEFKDLSVIDNIIVKEITENKIIKRENKDK